MLFRGSRYAQLVGKKTILDKVGQLNTYEEKRAVSE